MGRLSGSALSMRFPTWGEVMGRRWHKARPGRCPPASPLAGPLTLARVCPTLGQQIGWGCPLPPNLLADWPALDLPALRPSPQPRGRSWGLKGAVQGEQWGWAARKAGKASKQKGGTHTHMHVYMCACTGFHMHPRAHTHTRKPVETAQCGVGFPFATVCTIYAAFHESVVNSI